MYDLAKCCRICLCNNKMLLNLNTLDDDAITFLDKFKSCVPEIEISAEDIFVFICTECCDCLKQTYSFREKCMESNIFIQGYVLKQQNCVSVFESSEESISNFIRIKKEPEANVSDEINETITGDFPEERDTDFSESVPFAETNHVKEEIPLDIKEESLDLHEEYPLLVRDSNKQPVWRDNIEVDYIPGSKRPYRCTFCNKSFGKRFILTNHIKIHTGEKLYECARCSRRFSQKSHLKQHETCHTGERPHICAICGKSFTLKHNLNRHSLTHTQEKPHKCPTCGRGFSQKTSMQQHIRLHCGSKRHVRATGAPIPRPTGCTHFCPLCGKGFSARHHLKEHVATHSE